ncbi:hypothetical protein CEP49_06105 [Mergibacter septicus]|uniref:TM2 domain-containing protein n=1 Tax=Mergibacter septicus TaxID=221402 RepID=UPI0011798209|nr:TM2 domain-containing protein [Mergibacter septicus]AWX14151.1 hypothetical protein CEP49_06105 [Mergibacter septicus]
MDAQKFADNFVANNARFFPEDKIAFIKEKLSTMPEQKQSLVQTMKFKSPTVTLILAIILGGIDRFYIGDVGMGILKILTCFIAIGFLWWFIDIFVTYKKAKEANFNKLMLLI